SQIEVISTALLTPDVKDVFFSTFHEGLTAAGFTQENTSEETYGEHSGELTEYSFEHSGAKLSVSVFQFMMGNNAWLVVSYAAEDAADNARESVEEVASSLTSQDDEYPRSLRACIWQLLPKSSESGAVHGFACFVLMP